MPVVFENMKEISGSKEIDVVCYGQSYRIALLS